MLRALGEELDARRALGRALVVRRSALGPRHPLTLDTRERLEPLPYLEDMPPELDIDWDELLAEPSEGERRG